MLINAKSNNLPGLDPTKMSFEKKESYELHQDFMKQFDLTIEDSQYLDVYEILTPEVMQQLMANDMFDVWLNEKRLTLTTFGDQNRFFYVLPTMMQTGEMLLAEIDRIANHRPKS